MHTLMKNQMQSLQFKWEDIFFIYLSTACEHAKKMLIEERTQEETA